MLNLQTFVKFQVYITSKGKSYSFGTKSDRLISIRGGLIKYARWALGKILEFSMKLLMVIHSKGKLSENQRFLFDFETKYQTLNF